MATLTKASSKAQLNKGITYILLSISYATLIYTCATLFTAISHQLSLPIADLIGSIADDEFYVLQVAKNFTDGYGVTFDKVAPTTGFHPLYFVLLSAIYALFKPDLVAFITWAVALKSTFLLASCILIYFIFRKLTDIFTANTIGVILVCSFALHPYSLFLIFSGLEQLLSVFFLLSFILWLLMFIKSPHWDSYYMALGGVLLGLAFLSRTDNIVLVALGVVAVCLLSLRRSSLRQGYQHVFSMLVALAVVVAPWYLFIMYQTGSIGQGSSAIKTYLSYRWAQPFFERLQADAVFQKEVWWPTIFGHVKYYTPLIAVIVILSIAFAAFLRTVSQREQTEENKTTDIALLSLLIVYLFGIGLAYGYIFGWTREWYFGTSVTCIFLGLSIILFRILERGTANNIFAIGIVAVLMLGMLFNNATQQESQLNTWPHQQEMYATSQWIRDHVSNSENVGAWNSGILGYFSERRVTNLDGLINNDILPHLKNHDLYAYIEHRKLKYIADYKPMIVFQEPYLTSDWIQAHLQVIKKLPGTWSGGPMVVWQVQ